jgi:hypothetical protein
MNNIKNDLKELGRLCGMDSSDYWAEQVAGSCNHYDKTLHFTTTKKQAIFEGVSNA